MFSRFCLDIERVAVLVKCWLPITYVASKVVYENTLMISPSGLTAAITLSDNGFIHGGLSETKVSVYFVYN